MPKPTAAPGRTYRSPHAEACSSAMEPDLGATQLACQTCGCVEWLAEPLLLAPGRSIARDHGFTLEVACSILRGTCRTCRGLRAGGSH